MNKKTRAMTLSALFAALSVVLLYIASIWPTGQAGLVAVAALFVAAAVIENGVGSGISVFVVSSVLGMLVVPNRAAPILYIVFFGYYPVLKSLIEHIKSTVLQWVFKLLVFNAALSVVWFLLKELVINDTESLPGAFLLYLGGNIVFIIFDYGFSKLIRFYIDRISTFTR